MEEISEAESSYTSTNQLSAGGSRELWEWHRLGEFGQLLFWVGGKEEGRCTWSEMSLPSVLFPPRYLMYQTFS